MAVQVTFWGGQREWDGVGGCFAGGVLFVQGGRVRLIWKVGGPSEGRRGSCCYFRIRFRVVVLFGSRAHMTSACMAKNIGLQKSPHPDR